MSDIVLNNIIELLIRRGEMGAPTKYSVRENCLSFVSNYIEEQVDFRNIRYIETEGKVCHIYVRDMDCFDTYMTLASLKSQLPSDKFVQINRSCIVAIDEISAVKNENVILYDGSKLRATPNNVKEVATAHKKYVEQFHAKKTSQEISDEIEKYHLLDISPVPRCVIEMYFDGDMPMDFRFHYVNDAMVKLFGKESKEELLGKTFREAFEKINEKWLDFYAPTALYGTTQRVVIDSTEIQKQLYVKAYQPFYGYVVSIMQDISLMQEAWKRRKEF